MTIAFLLQGAIGGTLLIILALALIVGVVVLAGVFGGALGDRGGAGGEASQTESLVPPGTILAALGLGSALIGAFYSISLSIVGIVLGALAYYRGSRILGIVASVLSLAAIFVAYFLGGEFFKF